MPKNPIKHVSLLIAWPNIVDGLAVDTEVANLLRTCYRHGKLSWHAQVVHCVANKSARSCQPVVVTCNGLLETTRHKITQQTQQTFASANFLRTCYGEATGILV